MIKEKRTNLLFMEISYIIHSILNKTNKWYFVQTYLFSILFYKYLSDNIRNYINTNHNSSLLDFDYLNLSDDDITNEDINDIRDRIGYFLFPSQLFENNCEESDDYVFDDFDILEYFYEIFEQIQDSSKDTFAEENLKGIFSKISYDSKKQDYIEISIAFDRILSTILKFDIDCSQEKNIFNDAYQYFSYLYYENQKIHEIKNLSIKYFTPVEINKLLALLTTSGRNDISKIYDPACKSGSTLLEVKKILDSRNISVDYYGQESNTVVYNLCRMNMFLNGISFDKFNIKHGDSLKKPLHSLHQKYDVIVSNPPHLSKWLISENDSFKNDPRFNCINSLEHIIKNSYYAFILHSLYLLDTNGKAAFLCNNFNLYNDGDAKKIRKYLIDNNYIESIILLPNNLFMNSNSPLYILVLSKSKKNDSVLLINANNDEFIGESINQILSDDVINKIIDAFINKKNIKDFSENITNKKISENDYDLRVKRYIKHNNERNVNQNNVFDEINDLNLKIENSKLELDSYHIKIKKIKKQCADLLTRSKIDYLPLWKLTIWNGKISSVQDFNQNKFLNVKNLPEKEMKKILIKNGDTSVILNGIFQGRTNDDLANGFIYDGEVIFISKFGKPKINYKNDNFVSVSNWVGASINNELYNLKYIYYYLSINIITESDDYWDFTNKTNMNDVLQTKILIPPIEIQNQFVKILDDLNISFHKYNNIIASKIESRMEQYTFYKNNIFSFDNDE